MRYNPTYSCCAPSSCSLCTPPYLPYHKPFYFSIFPSPSSPPPLTPLTLLPSAPLPSPPQPKEGQAQCLPCPVGFICPDLGMAKPLVCPAGQICDALGLRSPSQACPPGHYCLNGTKGALHIALYPLTHL